MFRERRPRRGGGLGRLRGEAGGKRLPPPDRSGEKAMLTGTIPFDRYPGLAPLFHDFLRGLPDFFPDPPTIEAAAARGRSLLGAPSRIPAEAFRTRVPEAEAMARDLAAGRAVAVLTGHQVGLFTGPLFTITKAFDTIRAARQLREAGVAAVPVFWALTDDHDLEEIARTARPGKEGPEVIVLEGADRSNRKPVGGLPLPENVTGVLESFRADARGPEAEEILAGVRPPLRSRSSLRRGLHRDPLRPGRGRAAPRSSIPARNRCAGRPPSSSSPPRGRRRRSARRSPTRRRSWCEPASPFPSRSGPKCSLSSRSPEKRGDASRTSPPRSKPSRRAPPGFRRTS